MKNKTGRNLVIILVLLVVVSAGAFKLVSTSLAQSNGPQSVTESAETGQVPNPPAPAAVVNQDQNQPSLSNGLRPEPVQLPQTLQKAPSGTLVNGDRSAVGSSAAAPVQPEQKEGSLTDYTSSRTAP